VRLQPQEPATSAEAWQRRRAWRKRHGTLTEASRSTKAPRTEPRSAEATTAHCAERSATGQELRAAERSARDKLTHVVAPKTRARGIATAATYIPNATERSKCHRSRRVYDACTHVVNYLARLRFFFFCAASVSPSATKSPIPTTGPSWRKRLGAGVNVGSAPPAS
jgi:hypothetical protein